MALYIGSEKVSITPIVYTEEKTITASINQIVVTPTTGTYLKKVTVNPMPFNRYYVGDTDPEPSFGSDGDLYLKI